MDMYCFARVMEMLRAWFCLKGFMNFAAMLAYDACAYISVLSDFPVGRHVS